MNLVGRPENKIIGAGIVILNLSCAASMQNIISKYKIYKLRNGRPKNFFRQYVRLILKEVNKNSRISAPKLASSIVTASHKHVRMKTVQKASQNKGYRNRIPRKKPLISEKIGFV